MPRGHVYANLKFVVIDELHSYRGVFGSHLANVICRLKRIASFYGSTPTFYGCDHSNPTEHATKMIGMPVLPIADSGAPCGNREILVYNPPIVNQELGIRQNLKAL